MIVSSVKPILPFLVGMVCLSTQLSCSRAGTPTSERGAAPTVAKPTDSTAPQADAQLLGDMLTATEQKASLAPYPGARANAALPLAARPDGSVQFAFVTPDPMQQVVDHYVGELGLSFNAGLIAGHAKGRDFHIQISRSGTDTLVTVKSDPN